MSLITFTQRYDHTITLIKRKKKIISTFLELNGSLSVKKQKAKKQTNKQKTRESRPHKFALNSVIVFSLFRLLSPFEKKVSFTQGWVLPSLVEIASVILEEKMKM